MENKFKFIIDTESYVGNFERPMCAYCTGHVGVCEVGYEEAEEFKEDVGDSYVIFSNVEQVTDEEGCSRPVESCLTPNWYDNGMGFAFKDGQEAEALEEFKKSNLAYYEPLIERAKKNTHWKQEDIDRTIKIHERSIAEAQAMTEVHKYPSYMSVMIHFSSEPSSEQIKLMKERSQEFAERKNIKITGFRMQEIKTIVEEKMI